MGLKPDASILIVNTCDSDAYIQDAIEALRIMGQSATILLVVENDGNRMDALEKKYEISVVDIQNDEDCKKMAEVVIDYFGG